MKDNSKDNIIKFPKRSIRKPTVEPKEHPDSLREDVFEEYLQNGDKVLGCAHCEHSTMTIRLDGELFCGSCHEPAGPIDLIVEVLLGDY